MGERSHRHNIHSGEAAKTTSAEISRATMDGQFRIFKEMENKCHEKLFDFSTNPYITNLWGINPGRPGTSLTR